MNQKVIIGVLVVALLGLAYYLFSNWGEIHAGKGVYEIARYYFSQIGCEVNGNAVKCPQPIPTLGTHFTIGKATDSLLTLLQRGVDSRLGSMQGQQGDAQTGSVNFKDNHVGMTDPAPTYNPDEYNPRGLAPQQGGAPPPLPAALQPIATNPKRMQEQQMQQAPQQQYPGYASQQPQQQQQQQFVQQAPSGGVNFRRPPTNINDTAGMNFDGPISAPSYSPDAF